VQPITVAKNKWRGKMIKYGNNTFTSKLGIDGFWYLYMNDTEVYMCHDDNLPKDLKTVNPNDVTTVLIMFYETGVD